MAPKRVQLEQKTICCSICLDVIKDPVTTHCGHSYCMNCINTHWDGEDAKRAYSCPQCRQTSSQRPVLMKNTLLAVLVEDLKDSGLQAAPADHCYAGAEDVACDVCTGRKLKAHKSCLVCLASYCEEHLNPHNESPPFKKHKLVDPFRQLQENICSQHDEVMKMFCRTDQQCICYLCPVSQHKGHDTVSAAAERMEKQQDLELNRNRIRQKLHDREKDVKMLDQEEKTVSCSSDKAVEDSEVIFAELINFLEKRCSDVQQQIRSYQKTEMLRVKELQAQLQQEIIELKRKDAELLKLSYIEDDNHFLRTCSSMSPTQLSNTNIHRVTYFEDVTAAVSQVKGQILNILNETWTNILLTASPVQHREPKTRDEFLQYSQEITMDPNTANSHLLLSEGNRKVTAMREDRSYCNHPDRFIDWWQVCSVESLTGRSYWEVDWRGNGLFVAVTYRNVGKGRDHCEFGFGLNERSWALSCSPDGYNFYHNNVITKGLDGLPRSKIGVYMDRQEGILSFYSVSDTMTLLHKVCTTFTHPLHVGVRFDRYYPGTTAEFCKLKEQ